MRNKAKELLIVNQKLSLFKECQAPSLWLQNESCNNLNGHDSKEIPGARKKIKHYSVNACLAPVASLHGMAVTTVEGIGSTRQVYECRNSILIIFN